jgi:hypothetical protein
LFGIDRHSRDSSVAEPKASLPKQDWSDTMIKPSQRTTLKSIPTSFFVYAGRAQGSINKVPKEIKEGLHCGKRQYGKW